MASIRTRTTSSGTTRWNVLWREGNRQPSATFDNENAALQFKLDLELGGAAFAYQQLKVRGGANSQNDAPDEPTLTDWMTTYIDSLTGIHEGTRSEYHGIFRRHWKTALGNTPLSQLTRDQVAQAQLALSTRRRSAKTIANARGLLSAALDEAVLEDKMRRNPCRGLKLPRIGEDERTEMVCLTYEEFNQLYAQIPTQYQPLVLFLAGTGARWSEATALRVGDIDFGARQARIVRAWRRLPGGIEIGPPKTRRSRRTIKLPPELVDELRPVVKGRGRERLLFTNTGSRRDDDPVTIGTFRLRVWQPAIKRAQLPHPPRIHDLRHTHVSWLIAKGVELTTIQRRLGHESITTTSDTYGHLLPDVIERSAQAAGEVFRHLEADAKQIEAPAEEDKAVEGEVIDEEDD